MAFTDIEDSILQKTGLFNQTAKLFSNRQSETLSTIGTLTLQINSTNQMSA
jgi:hypothetical protein